ncbi:MAG: carbon-nitrogen family hydrolase [Anaerolineaceae bacterium]|nr:carbon-nitrogen family hydrolase [Anaerolineaceae bacterium]
MKTTISLAQMNIKQGDVKANFSSVLTSIAEAAASDSELLLLPELWSSGYDLANRSKYHRKNQHILPELLKAAQKHRLWIGGSWIEEDHGDFFNTFVLINSRGEIACKYSKVHLFGLMDEPQWFKGGRSMQVADFPWGKMGMAICYDLRFPELFRSYGLEGIPATILVAQWPARRINHWETLLKARAIENQMYMIAVNSVGQIGGEIFGGKSMVINPWGETLVEGSTEYPSLLTTEINLDEVQGIRQSMPVFKDRRPEVYDKYQPQ